LLELLFEPLEQGEGIGGRAGKPGNHAAIAKSAHLAGIGLHHSVAHRHLPVTRDHGDAAAPNADDGGAVPLDQAVAV
jgi:hypothetical protein